MVLASTSVLVVIQGPQSDCHHCLCSWGIPVVFYLSERFSKISKWVCPRLFSNFCLCTGPQSMRGFCMHPLKEFFFFFCIALKLPQTQILLAFQARDSGGSSCPCRTIRMRSLMRSTGPLLLGRQPLQLWFSCWWVTYPGVWVLTTPCLSFLPILL